MTSHCVRAFSISMKYLFIVAALFPALMRGYVNAADDIVSTAWLLLEMTDLSRLPMHRN